MNPVIDRMLTATAEIAEMLLAAKDSELNGLPAEAKLRIIELAEMASQLEDTPLPQPDPLAKDEELVEADITEQDDTPQVDEPQVVAGEIAEEVVEETQTASEPVDETVDENDSEIMPQTEPESEQAAQPEDKPMMADEEFIFDSTSATGTPADEPVSEAEVNTPEPAPVADLRLWRSLFSINDMFLFRRELFNGSESLMNDALAHIGTVSDIATVRQVLADRYGIDLRSRPAKDFMAIISTLFE